MHDANAIPEHMLQGLNCSWSYPFDPEATSLCASRCDASPSHISQVAGARRISWLQKSKASACSHLAQGANKEVVQKLLVCHTKVQQGLRFWLTTWPHVFPQDFLFGLGFAILGLEASAHADVAALTELALRSIERSAWNRREQACLGFHPKSTFALEKYAFRSWPRYCHWTDLASAPSTLTNLSNEGVGWPLKLALLCLSQNDKHRHNTTIPRS